MAQVPDPEQKEPEKAPIEPYVPPQPEEGKRGDIPPDKLR